jgi:predicted nucleotidyltransferase
MKTNHIKIELPKEKIADFCRRHHIRKLAVFGSALREDFRPDSDLDVLVEFDPEHTPGLAFFGMEQELSELLGRKVDLNTPQFLSPYFRDKVLAEAEVQYTEPRHRRAVTSHARRCARSGANGAGQDSRRFGY